jgi:hypothetical protein
MNERKKNKSAPPKKNVNSAVSNGKRGMTIDISGKAPGVSRTDLRCWIRTALLHLQRPQAELSLTLVRDPKIHTLNLQYRKKDKPTDVLSFPLADELQPQLLGDVIISVETAARQAQRPAILFTKSYKRCSSTAFCICWATTTRCRAVKQSHAPQRARSKSGISYSSGFSG